MTDEEIEKALYNADDIAISEDVDCYDILDYINRLKEQIYQAEQKLAECEVGYLATLDLERRMRADDKEQIRKDTAKDIFKTILNDFRDVEYYEFLFAGLQAIADDFYGIRIMKNGEEISVEMDDE